MVWTRLRSLLKVPDLPEPTQVTLPTTHSAHGLAELTTQWHPRQLGVRVAGAPDLVIADASLPRLLATGLRPPRILASRRDAVTLTADGTSCPVDPGRRAKRRSTYVATATTGGHTYRLRPIAARRAELRRGDEVVGRFTSDRTGQPPASMSWTSDATAHDVAIGVLLSHALGVGAHGVVRAILSDVTDLFVPG
ncbi:MAG TPA: hypothetical protein VIP77_09760 [Jiangellaceae bacterium]